MCTFVTPFVDTILFIYREEAEAIIREIRNVCPRMTLQSAEVETATIRTQSGEFVLRYAYCNQTGYYPEDPFKENQDSFKIVTNIGNNSSRAHVVPLLLYFIFILFI